MSQSACRTGGASLSLTFKCRGPGKPLVNQRAGSFAAVRPCAMTSCSGSVQSSVMHRTGVVPIV